MKPFSAGTTANWARGAREVPKNALPALIAGAKSSDGWHRYRLVTEIGSIDGEESLRFLLAEVKNGPHFDGRCAAALVWTTVIVLKALRA